MRLKRTTHLLVTTALGALLMVCMALPSALNAQDTPKGMDQYLNGVIQYGFAETTFRERSVRMETAVENRNQIEDLVTRSYQAGPESVNNIFSAEAQHKETAREVTGAVHKQRQQREAGAAANGEFKYIKYSDKTVFFQDGLTTRVEGQKELDEFGNMHVKNMYQMKYNEKRLLINYKGDSTDQMGNTRYFAWSGATYSPDSVFYATDETNAVKNLLTYTMEEMDHAGNVKITRFEGAAYEGKYLKAFSETIEDNIYGITTFARSNITYAGGDTQKPTSYHEEGITPQNQAYTLDRTSITYNGDSDMTGYHEVMLLKHQDGVTETITTDAQFTFVGQSYLFSDNTDTDSIPGRLVESRVTTTSELPDGQKRTETTMAKYEYADEKLVNASGNTEITGQEADWWEYRDTQGHLLGKTDRNGTHTYYYVDSVTKAVVTVPYEQVTAELQTGNTYRGTSQDAYEVLHGKAMLSKKHQTVSYYGVDGEVSRVEESTVAYTNGLQNNIQRLLGMQEHVLTRHPRRDPADEHISTQDTTTTYFYDQKGNLTDVGGSGEGAGWEERGIGGWDQYTSTIKTEYRVILGRPVRDTHTEEKLYGAE